MTTAATDASDGSVVSCSFHATGEPATGPLTWAQSFMWEVIRATNGGRDFFDFIMSARPSASAAPDVPTALERLAKYVESQPVLRACVEGPDDAPVQAVVVSGRFDVRVASSEEVDVSRGLRDEIPLIDSAFPCRGLLVVDGNVVVGAGLRISHLCTDWWGVRLLEDAFQRAMSGDAADDASPTRSPLAVAAEQTSTGQALHQRALEHARDVFRQAPQTMFPLVAPRPQEQRFWLGELRSARLRAAVAHLRTTLGLHPSSVVTGAIAAASAAMAGVDKALLFSISANRLVPESRSYPGSMSQESQLLLPVQDSLYAIMKNVSVKALMSARLAQYAPRELRRIVDSVERERGICLDKLGHALVVNLMFGDPDREFPPGLTASSSEVSPFVWTSRKDTENLALFVSAHVEDEALVLGLRVDTAILSPEQTTAFAQSVETIVVRAAEGYDLTASDVAEVLEQSGLRPVPDTAIIDGSRISVSRTASLVSAVVGRPVHVVLAGEMLTCYVPDPALSPESIHAAIVPALASDHLSMAPHRYVVVESRPSAVADAAWDQLDVVREGDGR
jgi:hypothetical protein